MDGCSRVVEVETLGSTPRGILERRSDGVNEGSRNRAAWTCQEVFEMRSRTAAASPSSLHSWRVEPRKAVRLQRILARRVSFRPFTHPVKRVAGCDVSYDSITDSFRAAVVVLSWPGMEILEVGRARGRVGFPYIPGLLRFREAPPILAAYRSLRSRPDLLLCDGQGLAHPRHFGLACHLGLWLDVPTIGCAKSILVGEHSPVPAPRGGRTALRFKGRQVGVGLRTREGVRPVYVSPGHRVSIRQAAVWTLRCAKRYRLPEPTRLADLEVRRMR